MSLTTVVDENHIELSDKIPVPTKEQDSAQFDIASLSKISSHVIFSEELKSFITGLPLTLSISILCYKGSPPKSLRNISSWVPKDTSGYNY